MVAAVVAAAATARLRQHLHLLPHAVHRTWNALFLPSMRLTVSVFCLDRLNGGAATAVPSSELFTSMKDALFLTPPVKGRPPGARAAAAWLPFPFSMAAAWPASRAQQSAPRRCP